MSEPLVRPVQVSSPYSGTPVRPRVHSFVDHGNTVEEAIWICPDTGSIFKRGIVSRVPVESTKKSN